MGQTRPGWATRARSGCEAYARATTPQGDHRYWTMDARPGFTFVFARPEDRGNNNSTISLGGERERRTAEHLVPTGREPHRLAAGVGRGKRGKGTRNNRCSLLYAVRAGVATPARKDSRKCTERAKLAKRQALPHRTTTRVPGKDPRQRHYKQKKCAAKKNRKKSFCHGTLPTDGALLKCVAIS